MGSYTKYTRKKDGKKFWAFQAYLGINELTGKPVRVSRRLGEHGQPFRTKKEASDEVARLKREYQEEELDEILRVKKKEEEKSFEVIANEWLERRYRETVKESTYLNTSNVFFKLHILPALGEYLISRIDKEVLEGVVGDWSENFIKHRYNLMVNYTKRVFIYALKEGYIKDNPFDLVHVSVVKEERTPDSQFYTRDEVIEFLDSCKGYGRYGYYWHVFFHFLIFTGVRNGEARALTWGDIDLNRSLVNINKTLSVRLNEDTNKTEIYLSDSTKNNEDRTITLDRITTDLLRDLKGKKKKDSELVFPALRGSGWMHSQSASNAMRNITRKNNLKQIKMHELRHTHCSLLFDAGVNVKEVQKRLGHKDVTITLNIYTHVTKDRQDEVADKLMDYVNKT